MKSKMAGGRADRDSSGLGGQGLGSWAGSEGCVWEVGGPGIWLDIYHLSQPRETQPSLWAPGLWAVHRLRSRANAAVHKWEFIKQCLSPSLSLSLFRSHLSSFSLILFSLLFLSLFLVLSNSLFLWLSHHLSLSCLSCSLILFFSPTLSPFLPSLLLYLILSVSLFLSRSHKILFPSFPSDSNPECFLYDVIPSWTAELFFQPRGEKALAFTLHQKQRRY